MREGLDELPILHSNPSATKKVFLDFDGQTITGTSWNDYNSGRPIHAPAYDLDGNILDFNSTEIARIQQIWQRVSEDFAPFNVDVTTEDPGTAFFASGGQGIRTMISTDRDDPRYWPHRQLLVWRCGWCGLCKFVELGNNDSAGVGV